LEGTDPKEAMNRARASDE
jgi:hypothetical protein